MKRILSLVAVALLAGFAFAADTQPASDNMYANDFTTGMGNWKLNHSEGKQDATGLKITKADEYGGIIIDEKSRGDFSLGHFYARRARRILVGVTGVSGLADRDDHAFHRQGFDLIADLDDIGDLADPLRRQLPHRHRPDRHREVRLPQDFRDRSREAPVRPPDDTFRRWSRS